jgi:uncharacterized protein
VTENAALRRLGRDRELIGFVVLTFILSWAWWIPIAVAGGTASHFPGLLGPMLAAVVVTAAAGGLRGLRRLPGRLGAPRWWALALSPLVVGAVAVGVAHATGDGPSLGALSDMPGLPPWSWPGVFLVVLLANGLGEETGWRGLAWPRLRQRLGLRDAALMLTVPWALWHLPLFWIDSGLAGLPLYAVPGWLVGLASGAVVLGWMYERSGSVLVVALAHTSVNMASATRGSEGLIPAAVSVAVIAAAVVVLRTDRRGQAPTGRWPEPEPERLTTPGGRRPRPRRR